MSASPDTEYGDVVLGMECALPYLALPCPLTPPVHAQVSAKTLKQSEENSLNEMVNAGISTLLLAKYV